MPAKKNVTINDVAAAAGVSKATVSRYLNGHLELMSEATQKRISTVIKMSNYVPSDIASNLRRRTTNLIGVLVADITSPFSTSLIVGISEYLEEQKYTLLITNSGGSKEKEKEILRSLVSKGVSGLLVNTAAYDNDNLVQTQCAGLPIVLCDRYVRNHEFDIVTTDPKEYFLLLVRHLKGRGYTRPILFTQEWRENSTRMLRREAFVESVQEVYGYDPTRDVYTLPEVSGGTTALLREIVAKKSDDDVIAIIGTNSVTTVRAYHAIAGIGLSIPDEIGLCGPEDWDWSDERNWPFMIQPHVTTIRVPSIQIGREAAKLLLEKIRDSQKAPQKVLVPCVLNERESTQHGV